MYNIGLACVARLRLGLRSLLVVYEHSDEVSNIENFHDL